MILGKDQYAQIFISSFMTIETKIFYFSQDRKDGIVILEQYRRDL